MSITIPKTLRIKVGTTHIESGNPTDECSCPIALATWDVFNEQFNDINQIYVGSSTIDIYLLNGDFYTYKMNALGVDFVERFDEIGPCFDTDETRDLKRERFEPFEFDAMLQENE